MACAGRVCRVPRSELEAVDGMDTAAASAHEAAAEETKTNRKSQAPGSQRRGCSGRGEQGGAPRREDGKRGRN